ncbi:DUF3977 family protein [Saccharibacillus endophyticus]|uniref:DUF3977 family protein n=1 Tax=Saccharibacillus endophyticus TaxID=2060666 RepID=A0ABQ1ZJD1_9BACL|nr:DUF3977 family protein [Saccharibacillus endophyticus]GGH68558.1 hypothetical protein GCM10007362_02700 [Saccharibacillus endophyticus]
MKKYIEIGIGNRWFIRTETEHEDGTETEARGIVGPFSCRTIYIRIWIGKKVWILDSEEGFKARPKSRKAFKIILGFSGEKES